MIKKLLKKNSHFLKVAVVLSFTLLYTACNKSQQPTPLPVPTQAPKVAVQPKPVQKTVSSSIKPPAVSANQFDFSNKKDPFKPSIVVKTETKNPADLIKIAPRNLLPIHSFDVNQFKLIGIITGGHENQAMVTDPGGKGYVLKVGMLIGKNNGRITSISSHGIEVLEQFKDDNGRVRRENIKLTLPRKQ
jgi:type IV pilus assembly protein PilP